MNIHEFIGKHKDADKIITNMDGVVIAAVYIAPDNEARVTLARVLKEVEV